MIKIEASPGRIIWLGYAGEDKVTKVIFPYGAEWLDFGEGEFYIRVLRPGETEPYNAADVTNDSEAMTLTLTVTDVELSNEGYGQMQVVYISPQAVKKSPIYRYRVSKAIDEPVDPPDGSIINEVVRSLAELTDEVGDISTALKAKADKAYVDEAISQIPTGSVDDVQINGTSVITDGVAQIPVMSQFAYGVAKLLNDISYGIRLSTISGISDVLTTAPATADEIKRGASTYKPITPSVQHYAIFYGLALAAGHNERTSTLPVGQYSEEAKTAIRTMLGLQDVYDDYSAMLALIGGDGS